MDEIVIEFIHFKDLIKRSDIKSPTWFAMEHNILNHPDFKRITGDEFKVYSWIAGVAAHLNEPAIRVDIETCAYQCRVKESAVRSAIDKLVGKRWNIASRTGSQSNPYGPVRESGGDLDDASATVQDSTGQDITVQDSTGQGLTKALPPLAQIWNASCGRLPKAQAMNKKRTQLAKALLELYSLDHLQTAIERLAVSDFANGANDRQWVADFDFFLKPDSYAKIIEGKYDNRKKLSQAKDLFKSPENLNWLNSLSSDKPDGAA